MDAVGVVGQRPKHPSLKSREVHSTAGQSMRRSVIRGEWNEVAFRFVEFSNSIRSNLSSSSSSFLSASSKIFSCNLLRSYLSIKSLKITSNRLRTLVHELRSERGQVHRGMSSMNLASSL
ncbi:hypothetical protein AG1IA_07753 [Rhizoctonia solani AG-1 IA]|uniref:Uncharacterized protein n=1 Tax=Thanatephorus cucumeris (strain AG1-IA) TaxID=983506 RepID=L8WJY8_THACA|nr:hypothetical protein AG1IA_07753 [Rhizoctonia solani AG-1 IA]